MPGPPAAAYIQTIQSNRESPAPVLCLPLQLCLLDHKENFAYDHWNEILDICRSAYRPCTAGVIVAKRLSAASMLVCQGACAPSPARQLCSLCMPQCNFCLQSV
jgi:hypothetical protein